MRYRLTIYSLLLLWSISALFGDSKFALQEKDSDSTLDEKAKSYLEKERDNWSDWNVPYSDGQILYDLIIKNNYTKALEIGTSTGHSGIWMAWALSKTGGKLITIEINEDRYREALAKFEEAGLSAFIDARLADAHELVKELKGPFDFVFCDADKGWYKKYFIDVYPNIEVGGCYTAHNVSLSVWGKVFGSGTSEFYEYIKDLPGLETTVDNSGAGLSISYKRSKE